MMFHISTLLPFTPANKQQVLVGGERGRERERERREREERERERERERSVWEKYVRLRIFTFLFPCSF